MTDKTTYIPRHHFTQYLTDIFIRNNQTALHQSVRALAVANGIDIKSLDIDDIIDKAVYASIIDIYSVHMMEKQDSVSDLVRNHLFNLVNSQNHR